MRRCLIAIYVLAFVAAVVGCSQPATVAPTSTAIPTRTTPATPTTVPTMQPTAVPPSKVDFPQVSRSITIIVQAPVGDIADSTIRLAAPALEKDLGAPVRIVNRPDASGKPAVAEVIASPPDGYTLMMFALPAMVAPYVDPDGKASYGRADFTPVAGVFADRLAIAVGIDCPLALPEDFVGYARAHPGDLAIGTTGNLSASHLGAVAWAEQAGVKFSYFHFGGGVEAISRMLIGRMEAVAVTLSSMGANARLGRIRLLGIMDDQESPLAPGVPTFAASGYPISAPAYYFLAAPAGTPSEVVEVLSAATKKVVGGNEYRAKLGELGAEAKYMAPADLQVYWTDRENWARPLVKAAKQ